MAKKEIKHLLIKLPDGEISEEIPNELRKAKGGIMEAWNKNWERLSVKALSDGRKIAHKNGGDFLQWDAEEGPDGLYVAATVRVNGGTKDRLIMWNPKLVEKLLRLVPEEKTAHTRSKGRMYEHR